MSDQRPNVLVYFPDGMQRRCCDADHICQTPNFERVAERGVRFSRAYTPSPTCSPARASLMTGLLPHNHGVLQVHHALDDDQSQLRDDKIHWAQRLSAAGYRTGYFGKWHIEDQKDLSAYGWDESIPNMAHDTSAYTALHAALNFDESESLIQEHGHFIEHQGYARQLYYGVMNRSVDELPLSVPLRAAMPFLQSATQGDQAWACCISDFAPNEALVCSKEYYDLYAQADIQLPASLDDDMEGRPNLYKRAAGVFADLNEAHWKEIHRCYYARISEMDAQFGQILDLLEERNQLDNTIIIISTDHGRYLGAHGMDGHNFGPFEEIYNIPLIMSGPSITYCADSTARVALHDLCPTILDLCDVQTIDETDAQSLKSLLQDPSQADRWQRAFAENHGTRFSFTQRVTWDEDWKYVFNGFDYDELYNIKDDPFELDNRINDAGLEACRKHMLDLHWSYINASFDKPLATSDYYTMHFTAHGPHYS